MSTLGSCSWHLRIGGPPQAASRVLSLVGRRVGFSVLFLDLIPSIMDFNFFRGVLKRELTYFLAVLSTTSARLLINPLE